MGEAVGTIEGDAVGEGVAVGVADADAEAEDGAALGVACVVVPAAWLLLVGDVQPAIDNEAITASTMMANNFFSIHVSPLTGKRIKSVQEQCSSLSLLF